MQDCLPQKTSSAEMPRHSVMQLTKLGKTTTVVCLVCFLVFVAYVFLSPSSPGSQTIDMKELLAVSIDLARRGGDVVREVRFSSSLAKNVKSQTKEGADEFVTAGDLGSHRAIRNGFEKAFPNLMVISEEHDKGALNLTDVTEPKKDLGDELSHIRGGVHVPMSDITVWIDPLDATHEYTENLTEFVTTMVCVAVKGAPVIGVVHNPFTQKTAWGWVSQGNSPKLFDKHDDYEKRAKYKIIVSRSHAGTVLNQLQSAFKDKVETVAAGGAGYKVLEVISGRADAYLHVTNIKKWDICAGNALLETGYGRMTTLKGRMINYSSGESSVVTDGLLATVGDQIFGLHALFLHQWKTSGTSLDKP